ncbi:MAG: aminoglycoside phosphotransferase, partial [Saprospiraceae bacterium]|nr:aminoglycoside phosphotransferase [Saprospiraceae bacterium]
MQHIVHQFFSHPDLLALIPFGGGHINQTYQLMVKLAGQQKAFILQQINQQVFKQPLQVIDNMRAVSQHIAQKPHYPLYNLTMMPTLTGDYYIMEEGNYWRLLPFI